MRSINYVIALLVFVFMLYTPVFAGVDSFAGNINYPSVSGFSVAYNAEDVKFASGALSGTVYPTISGLRPSGRPGAPKLPMDTYTIALTGKWDITGVSIHNVRHEVIPGKYNVVPNAEPFILQGQRAAHVDGNHVPDPSIYDTDEYFPGRWVNYTSGYDGEKTLVFVRVYPIQYNPVSGSLEFLSSGNIGIHGHRVDNTPRFRTTVIEAQNVIITTPEFASVAEYLRDAHEIWGTSTGIVYSDSIESAYSPAPGPIEFLGYAYDSLRPAYLSTYDYDLALKIIAFLRDESAHPELQSVTILGDASDIPPSYYAAFGYDGYEAWARYIPTDAFYASPDYDFIPNYAVGRLPVGNPAHANAAVQKLIETQLAATSDWFENAYFSGGSPWTGTYYESEIYISSIHNAGFCDALNSVRSYCSEGGFTYIDWTNAWWSGDYGIYWILAHGSGYVFAFDDWSEPDFGVTEFTTGSMTPPYPILFGGNCSNGIYDEDIIADIGSDPTFAEAFTRGPGGGSMLIAASRIAYGYSDYSIVDYETDINHQKYLPEFGYRMMEAISESPTDCGELFKNTTTYYVEHGEMLEDTTTLLTYFEMHMFGDPALPLPPIETHPVHNPRPSFEFITPFDNVTPEGAPVFQIDSGFVQISVDSGLAPVYAKALRASAEEPIYLTQLILAGGYNFPVPGGPQYTSLRIESADGKARWLYFLTSDGELVPDGYMADWIDADITPGGLDPNDFAEDYLELTDLYGYIDEEYLYIGFPFFGLDGVSRGYTICIDSRPGGGADNSEYGDAARAYVNFPGRAPDFEIVTMVYYDSYSGAPNSYIYFYEYEPSYDYWMWSSLSGLNACATVNIDSGFIEASIGLDSLHFDEEIAVLVYSFPVVDDGWMEYSSQDATPFNSGSHTTLVYSSTPNLLTEWLVLSYDGVTEDDIAKPSTPMLSTYPNPFNSTVTISVGEGLVPSRVEVFDINGRIVEELPSPSVPLPGGEGRQVLLPLGEGFRMRAFVWRPDDNIGSGVYLVRATIGDETTSKRIVYLK